MVVAILLFELLVLSFIDEHFLGGNCCILRDKLSFYFEVSVYLLCLSLTGLLWIPI